MNPQEAKLISGKEIANQIQEEVAQQIKKLGLTPGLAVILVGKDPASERYVNLKKKAAQKAGIDFHLYQFEENAQENEILETINWLNTDKDIHAMLIQLPLPAHLDEDKIIQAMDYKKDVDGFHPKNIKATLAGTQKMASGLGMGIIQLITATKEQLQGKTAVILARSEEFTKTLAYLLSQFGIHATGVQPSDPKSSTKTQSADIIITAAGIPGSLTNGMIKDGAIVIDVGTTTVEGKITGDVDASCHKKASWISPVPGGVGPMTVAMLLKNTTLLARLSTEKESHN